MQKEELIAFETRVKDLWEAKQIKCPIHLSGGNEEQLIEVFKDIKKGDYVFSTHRNHYHYLLHGGNPDALLKEILRQDDGLCRGHSGSMCTADSSINFFSSAIVGGVCGIATGVAWAVKESDKETKVWCFIGDGAIDNGHFWEALQYAEGWDLPVTFVVEDNDRSTCTRIHERLGLDIGVRYILTRMSLSKKVKYYHYKSVYPHVGSGVYLQF